MPGWFIVIGTVLAPLPLNDSFVDDRVLVTVNGHAITESQLKTLLVARRVPSEQEALARKQFLRELMERHVMRSFLEGRQAVVPKDVIDRRLDRVFAKLTSEGKDPEETLKRLGITVEALRAELELPVMWETHARRVIGRQQLREYFAARRTQFDGTELRASQIFMKLPKDGDDAAIKERTDALNAIRKKIVDGMMTFADAARESSESPSAKKGGDLGFFPYQGRMPREMTRAIFQLGPKEVSPVVRTRFGLHLFVVTERRPGQLSLEDARLDVFREMSDALWKKLAAEQLEKATVEYADEANDLI